ncbi:MAG: ATP-binding cassette domain-containing protein [Defluviitaleaceae bacterium]|nr:ATP-binding cassette domain-containing protein [Defluviitaleaceae bacterium]MCL2262867.1 ATP-binding cassette domain-containing protein [Defluviitaleaceae bacterium]
MIRLKNICKSFGEQSVLRDISMEFAEGITCIMGPSGVGKTTLINIAAGIIAPDCGEIIGLHGKKVSMIFQEDRLLEWETALTNVLFVNNNRPRAIELLTQAGLADSLHKKAADLSGGMKRRVCLCRALIAQHDLLILDEPFKGLDAEIKPSIMQMVKDHANGITICITHDPSEAEFLGGRVISFAS